MKLAEALQERADLIKRISQLYTRINNVVLVQEGEKPAEDPNTMLDDLRDSTDRLQTLIRQINETNCKIVIDGESLTAIIARRDILTRKLSLFKGILDTSLRSTERARGTEIKIRPCIDVQEIRRETDLIAKQLRIVDNRLQQANWLYDLIED